MMGFRIVVIALVLLQFATLSLSYGRFRGRSRHGGSVREPSYSNSLNDGADSGKRRNIYTGRFCSFTSSKRIPQRVRNGTQTYLRRTVSQCSWNSLYCSPQVRFVVSSRNTYAIQMREVKSEHWRCCPGFSGLNCENVCFNCSVVNDLTNKLDAFKRQVQERLGSLPQGSLQGPDLQGDIGPIGPAGPPGLPGLIGEVGPAGVVGSPGDKGDHGQKGDEGPSGFPGPRGPLGPKGAQGNPGTPGDRGSTGPQGEGGNEGKPGSRGEKGDSGGVGLHGPPGLPGLPGLPGACLCEERPSSTAASPTENPETLPVPRSSVKAVPKLVTEGPSMVEFCGSSLWKKSILQVSCDFDHETETRRYIERKQRHLIESQAPRGKGGTFCLMKDTSKRWKLENKLVIAKRNTPKFHPKQFVNSQLKRLPQFVNSTRSYVYPSNHYLIYRPSTSIRKRKQIARLFTPFFSNTQNGLCMSFRHLVRGRIGPRSGLLVFLLPCLPPYRIPVLNITNNSTSAWKRSVVPLPDYKRPYQVLFEARGDKYDLEYIAIDDVIFAPCGSDSCIHEGVSHSNMAVWKTSGCRECSCINGLVECSGIICPEIECQYKYKPSGYCCDVCCPNQLLNVPGSTDGSDESLSALESVGNNPHLPEDDDSSDLTDEASGLRASSSPNFNATGCPSASSRSNVSVTNEDAVCTLPKETGPCRGRFEKFYYDPNTQACRTFIYGGCEGNANNFDSPDECRRMCDVKISDIENPESEDICTLPKLTGPCRGRIETYYFDSQTQQCLPFIYGGCRGNENNFDNVEDCQDACVADACTLPKLTGPCRGRIEKYYYDLQTQQCLPFIYGGCRGNGNNFDNVEDCQDACVVDICTLPKVTGPCRGRFEKYYYDSQTQQCLPFIYGGCRGNENKFDNVEDCQDACAETSSSNSTSEDICTLPKLTGPCRGRFEKYYYDSQTQQCRSFIYGGCRGNENNFDNVEDCQDACAETPRSDFITPVVNREVCALPKVTGPCRGRIEKYYYDSQTQQCRPFIYGGCRGNENNFDNVEDCQEACVADTDVCTLPKVTGPCRGRIEKYYYDSQTQQCLPFIYGGCRGNENNFDNVEDCQEMCAEKSLLNDSNICTLPRVTGPCRGRFKKFYYDSQTRKCLPFIYGGCKGNENNFDNVEDCQEACVVETDICTLPKLTGPCRGRFEKYYYDSQTQQCLPFIYGGCRGNENKFDNVEDCQEACAETSSSNDTDICTLPRVTGPCRGRFKKFYYDSQTRKCLPFIYGGCKGNENNFDNVEDCQDACAVETDICTLPKLTGPCRGRFEKYYYDSQTQQCLPFIYGGCRGNENKFDNVEDCQDACAETSRSDFIPSTEAMEINRNPICNLPREMGDCEALLPRFYYDQGQGRCKVFYYGGCGGNENLFLTALACREVCGGLEPITTLGNISTSNPIAVDKDTDICALPKLTGPCKGRFEKYHYDPQTQQCLPFIYGGCRGNENKFDNVEDCQEACAETSRPDNITITDDIKSNRNPSCNLPRKIGKCKALLPRFYYDQDQGRCRFFFYGGCSGNDNRFLTPWACRDECGGLEPITTWGDPRSNPTPVDRADDDLPSLCRLPKVRGTCRASHSRFYYNPDTNKCQIFLYGGCGKNGNNFENPTDCERVCGGERSFDYEDVEEEDSAESDPEVSTSVDEVPSGCVLPFDSGPCRGHFYRYFYNTQINKCSVFLYGGCRGNENNFETPEDCSNTCNADGYNFTVFLKSDLDFTDASADANNNTAQPSLKDTIVIRGARGPMGPPGPIGPSGPPGPPGPQGLIAEAQPEVLVADEIVSLKGTIERLTSRILFLETEFLTRKLTSDDTEPIIKPSIIPISGGAQDNDGANRQFGPLEVLKESPTNRGDASDSTNGATYFYGEEESGP